MPPAKPKATKSGATSIHDLSSELLDGVLEECGDEAGAQLLGSDGLSLKIRGVISTQNAEIDGAIGRGGVPLGRLTILHGMQACVDEESIVDYNVVAPDGTLYNHGGTIKRLFELFHAGTFSTTRSGGPPPYQVKPGSVFTAPSVNAEGCIVRNVIHNVVHVGERECWRLRTEQGLELVATADHKIFNGIDYVPLSDLKVGDAVSVHVGARNNKVKKNTKRGHKAFHVPRHPFARQHVVNAISNYTTGERRDYAYLEITEHRAVAEAKMNDMKLEDFLGAHRDESYDLSQMKYVEAGFHVHHKDGNPRNNEASNLEVIWGDAHTRAHAIEDHNNLRFKISTDKVASIDYAHTRDVYDIMMVGPDNNYVVNKIVTHNSGKTTLALHTVASVQQMGGIAVYIDKEYKLDPEYAQAIGVDTSRLIISQPDYLEQIFKLMDSVVKRAATIREKHGRRVPILVILDSMNACITKEMFEADYGKREMAGVARVMSQNLPKLMPLVFKEDVGLLFISQVRQKMNVMFGDDEEISGGNAPKFFASLVLHVKRLGAEREGEEKVGNKIRVEPKKNQIASPFRKADVLVRYGVGFDREAALLSRGMKLEVVSKDGNTYSLASSGEKLGIGEANAIKGLRKNDTLRTALAAEISAKEPWNKEK